MYVILRDDMIAHDTYSEPIVFMVPEVTLQVLDKILVETCYGEYETFASGHCFSPNTPPEYELLRYPGVWGDATHLAHSLGTASLGELLSGKVRCVEIDNDDTESWSNRLRILTFKEYAEGILNQVAVLSGQLKELGLPRDVVTRAVQHTYNQGTANQRRFYKYYD